MSIQAEQYLSIATALKAQGVSLVAVSKTKPVEDIQALYDAGQRDFGENYVQELLEKQPALPNDVRWHFIGHLQSNKVKYLASFVHLIQSVDSWKLLLEIDKQAAKLNRVIDCLLQVHIASEETKFGLDEEELRSVMSQSGQLKHVHIRGLMGMASFTDAPEKVKDEFHLLKSIYDQYPGLEVLSMGMSGDYQIAIESGSNMVRIGSLLFGARPSAHL